MCFNRCQLLHRGILWGGNPESSPSAHRLCWFRTHPTTHKSVVLGLSQRNLKYKRIVTSLGEMTEMVYHQFASGWCKSTSKQHWCYQKVVVVPISASLQILWRCCSCHHPCQKKLVLWHFSTTATFQNWIAPTLDPSVHPSPCPCHPLSKRWSDQNSGEPQLPKSPQHHMCLHHTFEKTCTMHIHAQCKNQTCTPGIADFKGNSLSKPCSPETMLEISMKFHLRPSVLSNKQDPIPRSDSVQSPVAPRSPQPKWATTPGRIATCAHGPHGPHGPNWNILQPFAWLLGKPPNSKPAPLPTAANASVDSNENDQWLGHATVAWWSAFFNGQPWHVFPVFCKWGRCGNCIQNVTGNFKIGIWN